MWEKSSISYQLCNHPVLHNSCILTLWGGCFLYVFHRHLIFWEGKNKEKKVQTSLKITLLKSGGSGRSVGGGEEGRRRPCSSAVFDLSPLLGALIRVLLLSSSPRNTNTLLSSFSSPPRPRPGGGRVQSYLPLSSRRFFSVDLPGGTFSQNSGFYLWWREKSPKGNTRRNHQSAAWQES